MGTCAQFFIGDPRNVEAREWLGAVAWDGYPEGDIGEALNGADTEDSFREAILKIASQRDDFCDPAVRSFPFPWKDDLFLTDCTYALFDGQVQYASFHRGFVPLSARLSEDEMDEEDWDALSGSVPAPASELPRGPDSIMIFRAAS